MYTYGEEWGGGRRQADDRWRCGSLRWTFGEVEKRGEGEEKKKKEENRGAEK